MERRALARQRLGQIGGHHPALFRRGGWARRIQSRRSITAARHFERAAQLIRGVEQRLLVFLHVAIVGHGQALHGDEQRSEIAKHAPALAANQLQRIGILLLRHQAGPAGDAVAQFQPAELLAGIENPVFGQAAQMQHGSGCRIQKIEREIAVGRNIHAVARDGGEAQIARDGLTVERKSAAGQRSGARAASR